MGTRSYIGMRQADGSIRASYCHWDGYPAHNGVVLRDHWGDPAKAAALLAEGDLSTLGVELGEKHDFDDRSDRTRGWCKFYGRDRGEKGAGFRAHDGFEAFMEGARRSGTEYAYLHEGGVWRCWTVGSDYDEIDLNSRASEHWRG